MLQHLTTGEPAGGFRGPWQGYGLPDLVVAGPSASASSRAVGGARRTGPMAVPLSDGVSRRWRSALGPLEQCGAGGEDVWHVTHTTHSESRPPRAEHKTSPRHAQVKSSWFSKTNHLNYGISPSELRFVCDQLHV